MTRLTAADRGWICQKPWQLNNFVLKGNNKENTNCSRMKELKNAKEWYMYHLPPVTSPSKIDPIDFQPTPLETRPFYWNPIQWFRTPLDFTKNPIRRPRKTDNSSEIQKIIPLTCNFYIIVKNQQKAWGHFPLQSCFQCVTRPKTATRWIFLHVLRGDLPSSLS